jgi:hypothetical protein
LRHVAGSGRVVPSGYVCRSLRSQIETTQMYLEANLALKEQMLDKTRPLNGKPGHYGPTTDCWLPEGLVDADDLSTITIIGASYAPTF